VLGFDTSGLTLDYFDTAGSFHFTGQRRDSLLAFSWKKDDLWKTLSYELLSSQKLSFKYQSYERQDGGEPVLLEFTGKMARKRSAAAARKTDD